MGYLTEKSTERLMPRGGAWTGALNGVMREMTDGLSEQVDRDRLEGKEIIRDYYPYQTEQIEEWENILALPPVSSLSDDARRNRIQAVRTSLPVNLFSGQTEFINLSGFNVRCIPLEEAQDPNTIPNVLEVIGDGRYAGLNKTFPIPPDSATWTLLYIVENLDGSIIELTPDLYNTIRFLILKAKPPFMWVLLRGVIV